MSSSKAFQHNEIYKHMKSSRHVKFKRYDDIMNSDHDKNSGLQHNLNYEKHIPPNYAQHFFLTNNTSTPNLSTTSNFKSSTFDLQHTSNINPTFASNAFHQAPFKQYQIKENIVPNEFSSPFQAPTSSVPKYSAPYNTHSAPLKTADFQSWRRHPNISMMRASKSCESNHHFTAQSTGQSQREFLNGQKDNKDEEEEEQPRTGSCLPKPHSLVSFVSKASLLSKLQTNVNIPNPNHLISECKEIITIQNDSIIMSHDTILPTIQISSSTLLSYLPSITQQSNNQNKIDYWKEIPMRLQSTSKPIQVNDKNFTPWCSTQMEFYILSLSFKDENNLPSQNYWKASLIHPNTKFHPNHSIHLKILNSSSHVIKNCTSYLPYITLSLKLEDDPQDGFSMSSLDHSLSMSTSVEESLLTVRAEALVPVSKFSMSFTSAMEVETLFYGNDWEKYGGILKNKEINKAIGIWISWDVLYSSEDNIRSKRDTDLQSIISKHPLIYSCCLFYQRHHHAFSKDPFWLALVQINDGPPPITTIPTSSLRCKVTPLDTGIIEYESIPENICWKVFDYEADISVPSQVESCLNSSDVNQVLHGQFRPKIKGNKPVYYSLPCVNTNTKALEEHEQYKETIVKQQRQIETMQSQIEKLSSLLQSQQRISSPSRDNPSLQQEKDVQSFRMAFSTPSSSPSMKEEVMSKLSNSPASFFDQSERELHVAPSSIVSSASMPSQSVRKSHEQAITPNKIGRNVFESKQEEKGIENSVSIIDEKSDEGSHGKDDNLILRQMEVRRLFHKLYPNSDYHMIHISFSRYLSLYFCANSKSIYIR